MLFVIEDNGYAISTPVEVNTPGGNISRLVANFPNFHFAEVDGTDPMRATRRWWRRWRIAARGWAGVGAWALIRPYSHSLSDDERLYRSAAEREADALRDPISRMQMRLLREGILTREQINELEKEVDEEVQRAADRALEAPLPTVEIDPKHVYSEDLSPMDARFADRSLRRRRMHTERTMADLINAACTTRCGAIRGSWSSAKTLPMPPAKRRCGRQVKGKGGVFKLTAGLQTEFGNERVLQLAAGRGEHRGPGDRAWPCAG